MSQDKSMVYFKESYFKWISIMILALWKDPDIIDAIIHYLMK